MFAGITDEQAVLGHDRHRAGRTDRPVRLCRFHALALQLPFLKGSESMGNHDSEIVDAGSVD
jgi:hypothetical protein